MGTELPRDSHFRIIVHIEKMPAEDPPPLVSKAFRNYFDYKSMLAKCGLRLLLIEGRTSLVKSNGFGAIG